MNFGPLTTESVRRFGAPLQISTGFASWQLWLFQMLSISFTGIFLDSAFATESKMPKYVLYLGLTSEV